MHNPLGGPPIWFNIYFLNYW